MGSLGCVHTKPPLSLWQLDGLVDQDVDLAPVMVGWTARRMHVVRESNHALSAVEEASNSRLNMPVP